MKFALTCMLLCVGFCRYFTSARVVPTVDDDNHWSYLILAHFWPESSCIYFKEEGKNCSIPPNVRGWTIHGLWPSRPDSTQFPSFCNSSMPFDMEQIKDLRSKLDVDWHFYEKTDDPTYLWNHEWTKHGTCAFSSPDLRGEFKFFNKTLELHSHINLTEALAKSDITPSDSRTHKREDFFNALQNYYNVKPYLVCDWDNEAKKAYIDQIYLCYNKTFHLQDCYPTPSRKVDASGTVTYSDPPSYYDRCLEQDNLYYLPYNVDTRRKGDREDKGESLLFQSENSIKIV